MRASVAYRAKGPCLSGLGFAVLGLDLGLFAASGCVELVHDKTT